MLLLVNMTVTGKRQCEADVTPTLPQTTGWCRTCKSHRMINLRRWCFFSPQKSGCTVWHFGNKLLEVELKQPVSVSPAHSGKKYVLFVGDWAEEGRRAVEGRPVYRGNVTPLCRPFISSAMKLWCAPPLFFPRSALKWKNFIKCPEDSSASKRDNKK